MQLQMRLEDGHLAGGAQGGVDQHEVTIVWIAASTKLLAWLKGHWSKAWTG